MIRLCALILLAGGVAVAAIADSGFSAHPLRTLEGEQVTLNDYLEQGPVVIEFWASWCKPCMTSLPKLNHLYRQWRDQGVTVLGINQDGPRSLAKIEPLVYALDLEFPILLDENRDFSRQVRISGLPTTLLVDSSGEILFTLRGYRPGDENRLDDEIRKLLGL